MTSKTGYLGQNVLWLFYFKVKHLATYVLYASVTWVTAIVKNCLATFVSILLISYILHLNSPNLTDDIDTSERGFVQNRSLDG